LFISRRQRTRDAVRSVGRFVCDARNISSTLRSGQLRGNVSEVHEILNGIAYSASLPVLMATSSLPDMKFMCWEATSHCQSFQAR
jgi:hypothetical protein